MEPVLVTSQPQHSRPGRAHLLHKVRETSSANCLALPSPAAVVLFRQGWGITTRWNLITHPWHWLTSTKWLFPLFFPLLLTETGQGWDGSEALRHSIYKEGNSITNPTDNMSSEHALTLGQTSCALQGGLGSIPHGSGHCQRGFVNYSHCHLSSSRGPEAVAEATGWPLAGQVCWEGNHRIN